MAKEHDQEDPAEVTDRIWELAKKIDIFMFTTWDGQNQRNRPLSARVYRKENAIHLLADVEGQALSD